MKLTTRFQYWSSDQGKQIGNLGCECMSCARTCSATSETIKCQVTRGRRRRGVKDVSDGRLYVCTAEAIKSARMFHEKVRAFSEVIHVMGKAQVRASDDAQEQVLRLVHNLITLNAQTIQAIHRVVPQDDFSQKDRESLIHTVSKRLSDSEKVALLVIDLLKNANLEKTEFAVYAKLREQEPVNRQLYPIHKIFMLILNTYWDALRDKDVRVDVGRCQDRVYVDYDTIAASLVHLLDNTVKYILPGSRLSVLFEPTAESMDLILDMVSLRIHAHELHRLTQEGFSGEEAKKIGRHGEGRGLYLIEQLLSLSKAKIRVEHDFDTGRRVHRMGVNFENNRFLVSMPRG